MVVTTNTLEGEEIKLLIDDSVVRFIKTHAVVESDSGGQKIYKINSVSYTLDDE